MSRYNQGVAALVAVCEIAADALDCPDGTVGDMLYALDEMESHADTPLLRDAVEVNRRVLMAFLAFRGAVAANADVADAIISQWKEDG